MARKECTPQISVIVPVYNVEKYIHRCVDSILGQSYADFELILVDDGSPDNCGAICDEYARKDSRIVVIHQENGGLSAARNAGIDWAFANSDSEWLTFVDSDDWIHTEMLGYLLTATNSYDASVISCDYLRTRNEQIQDTLVEIHPELWKNEEFYLHKGILADVAWGKLYRKDQFKNIRFPVGRKYEDCFTTYKLLFAQDNIVFVPAYFYYYYDNPESIINSPFSMKNYDGILAREERIIYFSERGFAKIVENEKKGIIFESAYYSIAARKMGLYSQVPEKYKMSLLRAIKIVKSMVTREQFEWIMCPYYPQLIRFFAVIYKLKSLVCKQDPTSEV